MWRKFPLLLKFFGRNYSSAEEFWRRDALPAPMALPLPLPFSLLLLRRPMKDTFQPFFVPSVIWKDKGERSVYKYTGTTPPIKPCYYCLAFFRDESVSPWRDKRLTSRFGERDTVCGRFYQDPNAFFARYEREAIPSAPTNLNSANVRDKFACSTYKGGWQSFLDDYSTVERRKIEINMCVILCQL